MEDVSSENHKKRARDDSDLELAEFDRVDSDNSGLNSPEAKRIREDILDILDDSADTVTDRDPPIQDLDLVIRSLEQEIMHPPPPQPAVVVDAAVPQPDLGYLLEASDDELGLPPAVSPTDEQTKIESMDVMKPVSPARGFAFDEAMVLEEEIPSYDSFEWRIVEETREVNEFVTLGGLFDYPESFDFSEFPQPELSAL